MAAIDVSTLSDDERLALAKQLASNIRGSLPKELYAGSFTLKSKIPYKASSFREVLIHRLSDLADVAIDLYEANRLVEKGSGFGCLICVSRQSVQLQLLAKLQ